MSSRYLLVCIASDKKSAVILIFVPLYLMYYVYSEYFKDLENHWLYIFNFDVLWYGFVYILVSLLGLLDLWVYGFHQIWKVWEYYFFKLFFVPFSFSFPSETPVTYIS